MVLGSVVSMHNPFKEKPTPIYMLNIENKRCIHFYACQVSLIKLHSALDWHDFSAILLKMLDRKSTTEHNHALFVAWHGSK